MIKLILLSLAAVFSMTACSQQKMAELIKNDLDVAGQHLSGFAARFDTTAATPRSWNGTKHTTISPSDWTIGFFPGTLWLYYQLTGDKKYEALAEKYTARIAGNEIRTDTHDLGFIIFCSYGKQQEVKKDSCSAAMVIAASKSLVSRFDPKIGLIRSWGFGDWNYPVIIDNMMNLEMLFWASEYTGDSTYRNIAIKHADRTLENHFREDNTCYHVVSYNNDGSIESKGTYQGYSDDSAWARGQAWALYGYTMCYRYTRYERYLRKAVEVAEMIMNLKDMPEDLVPYWDYNAPGKPDVARDASAAAISASALFELSSLTSDGHSQRYFKYAEDILRSLSSDEYLAAPGDNGDFILKHCTGAAPFKSEVDAPLVYADYYFLEAIKRYLQETK